MSDSVFIYKGGEINTFDISNLYYKTVIIDEGVTAIEDGAFSGWASLETVEIKSISLQTIGDGAFCGCINLKHIYICGDNQEGIDNDAILGSTDRGRNHLPPTLLEIAFCAFKGCTSLQNIVIPPSVSIIGHRAFSGCTSLSDITIPNTVKIIDYGGFAECSALTSIKLPGTLDKLDVGAFAECTKLQSIQVPPSTSIVKHFALGDCKSLSVAYVPSATIQDTEEVFARNLQKWANSNLILLTDTDRLNYETVPSLILHDIQQCIHHDLQENIPPSEQLNALKQALHFRFSRVIYRRAERSGLSLLHFLVYFPGDIIYEPLVEILQKCPQAAVAVDSDGKTPLHHVITSTQQHMSPRCYDLLLSYTPDKVVHQAIKSKAPWHEVLDIMKAIMDAKRDALGVEDEISGLVPFMSASASMALAEENSVLDLSAVYELLRSKPDVLKIYNPSNNQANNQYGHEIVKTICDDSRKRKRRC